jgi:hypothetical protein
MSFVIFNNSTRQVLACMSLQFLCKHGCVFVGGNVLECARGCIRRIISKTGGMLALASFANDSICV